MCIRWNKARPINKSFTVKKITTRIRTLFNKTECGPIRQLTVKRPSHKFNKTTLILTYGRPYGHCFTIQSSRIRPLNIMTSLLLRPRDIKTSPLLRPLNIKTSSLLRPPYLGYKKLFSE